MKLIGNIQKKRSSYSCAHDSSTSLFQLVQGPLGLLFGGGKERERGRREVERTTQMMAVICFYSVSRKKKNSRKDGISINIA